MQMENLSDVPLGQLEEIDHGDIQHYAVGDMAAGVADIIGVPESPADVDKNLSRTVLWIEATTLDGETHRLMFLPTEGALLEEAIREFKRAVAKQIMDQAPQAISELVRRITEISSEEDVSTARDALESLIELLERGDE